MDLQVGSEFGGCDCGWEAHPQSFRWFPELGSPLEAVAASSFGVTSSVSSSTLISMLHRPGSGAERG